MKGGEKELVKRVGKKPLRLLINKAVFEGLAEGQPVKSGGSLAPADTLPRTEGLSQNQAQLAEVRRIEYS